MSTEDDVSDILEQLHNSVISGSFDNALHITKLLVKKGHANLLKDAVARLLDHGTPNIMGYAFLLWLADEQDLVIAYFPIVFKLLFNGDKVSITDHRLGYPMKLNDVKEGDGDRKAYGDYAKFFNDERKWRFSAIWERNSVYFKIRNERYLQYLKLVRQVDEQGDRRAFGCIENETNRHQWYLQPVTLGGNLFFYIMNRKYDMPLKLGDWEASNGDRIVWGHNGQFTADPELFRWKIEYS